MKLISFCFWLFVFPFTNISGQQNHFLYFQTEFKQPFYIKLEDKVLSSSSSGYLIVPKLKDGNYTLRLGFPNHEWPEQKITYKLEGDAGFLLKNFPDKGWGFFDLQSLRVIMPENEQAKNAAGQEVRQESRNDNFSAMLAMVVNDSTIKQSEVVVTKEVPQSVVEKAPDRVQPVVAAKESVYKPDTAIKPRTAFKSLYSVITRNLQIKSKEGVELIYIDEYDDTKDTIRILIPAASKEQSNKKMQEPVEASRPADVVQNAPGVNKTAVTEQKTDTAANVGVESSEKTTNAEKTKTIHPADTAENIQTRANPNESLPEEQKTDTIAAIDRQIEEKTLTIDSTGNAKNDSAQVIPDRIAAEGESANTARDKESKDEKARVETGSVEDAGNKLQRAIKNAAEGSEEKTDSANASENGKMEFLTVKPPANTNCKQYATEDDFLRLRRKMAGESNDDDMIRSAKRVFKSKCFTTKDIKNLSALFLTDEGKYNFFDAAYLYVSDADIFYTLQSQLADGYYIKRFQAMIRQ